MDEIKSVSGPEPMREGEYALAFIVGYGFDHVDRKVAWIQREEENLGTYGIVWFVAYDDQGREIGRMNAVHVFTVVKETLEARANV